MKSILASFIAFIIPMSVAFTLGGNEPNNFAFLTPTVILFMTIFVIQWIAFIPANIFKTEKFFDITGGVTYIVITWIAWLLVKPAPILNTILALSVSIWAVRLASFLFSRIHKAGSDTRFTEIKRSAPRFFLTWTLQGTWISLVSAPTIVVLTSNTVPEISYLSFIGLLVWAIGLMIEIVADHQKTKFRADPANNKQFISTGLWSISRHPNYFGEWLVWVGIFIIALPSISGWQYLSVLSPIFVYLLLTRVSGIPLLEQQGRERWGSDEKYQLYLKTVPEFFPTWKKFDGSTKIIN